MNVKRIVFLFVVVASVISCLAQETSLYKLSVEHKKNLSDYRKRKNKEIMPAYNKEREVRALMKALKETDPSKYDKEIARTQKWFDRAKTDVERQKNRLTTGNMSDSYKETMKKSIQNMEANLKRYEDQLANLNERVRLTKLPEEEKLKERVKIGKMVVEAKAEKQKQEYPFLLQEAQLYDNIPNFRKKELEFKQLAAKYFNKGENVDANLYDMGSKGDFNSATLSANWDSFDKYYVVTAIIYLDNKSSNPKGMGLLLDKYPITSRGKDNINVVVGTARVYFSVRLEEWQTEEKVKELAAKLINWEAVEAIK